MKGNIKKSRGKTGPKGTLQDVFREQKEQKAAEIADYRKQLKQIACQMMRVYVILGMESRVIEYFEFLLDNMKMDVDSIMEMYESVSITTNHLLNTIKAEEEGYWEKGIW